MLRGDATAEFAGTGLRTETVRAVEIGIDAHVPASFIGYEAARVRSAQAYRLGGQLEELSDLRAELTDRFGEITGTRGHLIFLGGGPRDLTVPGRDSCR